MKILSPERAEILDPSQLASELDANLEQGLSASEARQRLDQCGPNSIEQEERSAILLLLSHFWGPIPWMIEVAAILSAVAGRWDVPLFALALTMAGIPSALPRGHDHHHDHRCPAPRSDESDRLAFPRHRPHLPLTGPRRPTQEIRRLTKTRKARK